MDEALTNLRERAARYEPVDGRGIQPGDSVVMDLVRTAIPKQEAAARRHRRRTGAAETERRAADRHTRGRHRRDRRHG